MVAVNRAAGRAQRVAHRAPVFLLLFTLFVLGESAVAQPRYIERVDVARVLVDARVVDNTGGALLGLEPADFVVRIDGQPARVESVLWAGGAAPELDPSELPGPAGLLEVGVGAD